MSAKVLPFVSKEEKAAAQSEQEILELVKGFKAMLTEEQIQQFRLDLATEAGAEDEL